MSDGHADDDGADATSEDDGNAFDSDAFDGDGSDEDDAFERELANARALLDAEDVTAVHVGVVHGDEVDATFAQAADDPHDRGVRALTLLATHLRLVAAEAGVDYETVADDAAQLAGRVEELPGVAGERGEGGDSDIED